MTYRHIDGVAKALAQFSNDRKFRYRLDIFLPNYSPAHEMACVVMQNPSYACEKIADKSVQFMEKNIFLRGLPELSGVRRLVVVNQFALIQTNNFKAKSTETDTKNDDAIRRALLESEIVIIAWGKANRFRERQDFVLGLLQRLKGKKLFQTRMHPARGHYKDFIRPVRIENGSLVS